jgi:hypothetical protein
MKLLRWAAAGASAYVIYKYSIGKKAVGEDVFDSPERAIADMTEGDGGKKRTSPTRTKRKKAPAVKVTSK